MLDWRFCLALATLLGICVPGLAQTIELAAYPQGLLCRSAVAAAERAGGIPGQLLAAISRVEAGRRDPATGAVHPWPWTVNAEGQGYFYDTKAEAVAGTIVWARTGADAARARATARQNRRMGRMLEAKP